jgi:Protein of unknown function (DUF4435)
MSSLVENLSSDWMAAQSRLAPKESPNRVLVYVESYGDSAFWRNALAKYESDTVKFDIQIPSHKGKSAVLKLSSQAGKHLILCVDSDYDYLLQNTTETSALINQNEFIFQTYTYSIENYQCFSKSLHAVCVQATKNDNKPIDFEALMVLYSQTISKLFYWSVYLTKKYPNNIPFTISQFSNCIKLEGSIKISDQFQSALEDLTTRVQIKLTELETTYSDEIPELEAFKEDLINLGVDNDQIYLFAHGHTIMDNVVLPFLDPISKALVSERETTIRKINTMADLKNIINQYQNARKAIKDTLHNNTEYKSCFLYQKIEQDLSKYMRCFDMA